MSQPLCAIGIDVGGTKIAGGLVLVEGGGKSATKRQPTQASRGGMAVLRDVAGMAVELKREALSTGLHPCVLGVGLAELVSPEGRPMSKATIDWLALDVGSVLSAILPWNLEADVRAAALAEADLGAGRNRSSFVYVTVGTGISACWVKDGVPHTGSRGLAGTFASSPTLAVDSRDGLVWGDPLEQFASGPAIASRYRCDHGGALSECASEEVLRRAGAGDVVARNIVESAADALGASVAQLVNTLDPEVVLVGGGLGSARGLLWELLVPAIRARTWSEAHRDVPILQAQLGSDAGWVGAGLAAARGQTRGVSRTGETGSTSPR